jgi:AcrR family transcriptional regulator
VSVKRTAARERRALAEQAVLEATMALLGEGTQFADLTVEQIAARAGISRPAFYGHFIDKGALLIRLIETIIEPVYLEAKETLESLPSGPVFADDALRAIAQLLLPHYSLVRSVIQISTYDAEVAARWQQENDRLANLVAERIRGQQEAGLALPGDADDLAHVLVGMTLAGLGLDIGAQDPARRAALLEATILIWRRAVYGGRPNAVDPSAVDPSAVDPGAVDPGPEVPGAVD